MWRPTARRRFAFAINSDGVGVSLSTTVAVGRGDWRGVRAAARQRARNEGVGRGLHVGDIVVGVDPGKVNLLAGVAFRVRAVGDPVEGPQPELERFGAPLVLGAGHYRTIIGTDKHLRLARHAQDAVLHGRPLLGPLHVAYLQRWKKAMPTLHSSLASDSVERLLEHLSLGLPRGQVPEVEPGGAVPWLDLWYEFAFGVRRRQIRWKAEMQAQRGKDIITREFVRSFEDVPPGQVGGAASDRADYAASGAYTARCTGAPTVRDARHGGHAPRADPAADRDAARGGAGASRRRRAAPWIPAGRGPGW